MGTSLFVYGTLLSAHAPDGLLAGAERREAWIGGRLYDLPAGYPALVVDLAPGEERTPVWGELVSPVDARVFSLLDLYEGVPQRLYARRELDVRVGLRTVAAWVYVMDGARARRGRFVPSGRWRPTRRR